MGLNAGPFNRTAGQRTSRVHTGVVQGIDLIVHAHEQDRCASSIYLYRLARLKGCRGSHGHVVVGPVLEPV